MHLYPIVRVRIFSVTTVIIAASLDHGDVSNAELYCCVRAVRARTLLHGAQVRGNAGVVRGEGRRGGGQALEV